MCKNLATIAAAFAILAVGTLASYRAEAGASASAPSKYGHATQSAQAAALYRVRAGRLVRPSYFGITEYSSSSARGTTPKR